MKHTETQLKKLSVLISYQDRYEISIQFWPSITCVFICKGGIDLTDYGGDFDYAIDESIAYLKRVNSKSTNK